MNNKICSNSLILAMATLLNFSLLGTASATPAFSRQINADCRTCHFQSMQTLNKFGRAFKLNAFNLSEQMKKELKQRHENKAASGNEG